MNGPDKALPGKAVTALRNGSKIEAIKHVRETHHVGLKEAKEIVERYIDANADVRQHMSAANAESAKGCMGWVALLLAAALAVYYSTPVAAEFLQGVI